MSEATRGFARRLAERVSESGNSVGFRFLARRHGATRDLRWEDVWRQGTRGASHLIEAGLAGRRVGLLCPAAPDLVLGLVAAILAGAIAVPMPATLNRRSAPRIRSIAQAADLAAVIAPESIFAADWLMEAGLSSAIMRVTVEVLRSGDADRDIDVDTDPARPLLLQFTSGSTGAPRGVLLSHANIAANCAAIATAYDIHPGSIGVSWLPLHHDMGLVGHLLMPLWQGGRSAFMDPLVFLQKPLSWLEAVSNERATITSAPNFAYELCTRAAAGADALELDLSSLTAAICGGEPVMPETMENFIACFQRFGFKRAAFAPSYGLAEATLLVASGRTRAGPMTTTPPRSPASASPERSLTVLGEAVPGMRLRVTDPESRELVADGTVGEVEIAGTSVGQIDGMPPGGWLPTGDLGFLWEGRLCIAGRRKELLILRGQNVFPADVEAAAQAVSLSIVPGGCAAVGVERGGTQVMIVIAEVRPTEADESDARQLGAMVGEAIAAATSYVPDDVVLVGAGTLPRTTSGKLRRGEIAALYLAGKLQPRSAISLRPKVPFAHA